MNSQIGIYAIVAITFTVGASSCRESKASGFDYGSLTNVATVCEKDGDVWTVHYGKDQQGIVFYVIFNRGSGPSPVSVSDTLRSDGSHKGSLQIEIAGAVVSPPDTTDNLMIIAEGKVMRGKFKPIPTDRFQKVLRDSSISVSAFSESANQDVE